MIFLLDLISPSKKNVPLENCIRNTYRHIKKWAKRTNTDAFRIYDRDIKEHPFIIDYYAGRFCIQHIFFESDGIIPSHQREAAISAIKNLFQVDDRAIYEKVRIRRARCEQYEKQSEAGEFFTVFEYGIPFLVNLSDYLDTGLFLDHRTTRQLVAKKTMGKKLLNLFSYTASFSVQAARAGAAYTKSVDMSNTYCEWAKRNFLLNNLSLQQNEIVRADCLPFLDEEIHSQKRYDTIVIDPPTVSRSKKMNEMFDIQKDYILLLSKASILLQPDGTIFFSTNSRRFTMDYVLEKSEEITSKTIPFDFRHTPTHRVWLFYKNYKKNTLLLN